ncbi:hypothetical protein ACQY0O_002259 [Thecaphora frezii]
MTDQARSSNPVLALVSQSDTLASGFTQLHASTLAPVQALLTLPPPIDEHAQYDSIMASLRTALTQLEAIVGEMMAMLYNVDLFLSQPTHASSAYDPREACRHVSELFHMYQAELLNKRELLSDFTCGDIETLEFVHRWSNLDEVQQAKKQQVDDLADLLSSFG